MNNKLKELASHARWFTTCEVSHLSRIHNREIKSYEADEIFENKFAELIIRKCADIALKEDHEPSECILNYFGVSRE